MTGRWRVIQKKPDVWRVIDPSGKTIAAYPTRERAFKYANRLAWGELFGAIVESTWPNDRMFAGDPQ